MGAVVRILFLCLVVGLLLSYCALDPRTLLTGGWDAVLEAWRFALSLASWAVPYVLLGATVVVPIAIAVAVVRLVGSRRRGP